MLTWTIPIGETTFIPSSSSSMTKSIDRAPPHPSMATSSGLAPNSFLVATPKSLKIGRRFVVVSKNAAPKEASDEPKKPFQFNFGKLPDIKSLVPVVSGARGGGGVARRKDEGTVYVAGGNGQVGVRIVQALLRQGFKVRAGVSDISAAQELARFAALYKVISNEESKSLNAVQSTFDDAESIAKSIGNASKVVVTIGPTENGPDAVVTTSDALQVVEAAQLAGVSHVAIIYDESASTSSTYNVLDGITSFFNNLFAKSQPLTVQELLQRVVQTDVRYTFIKTKLTDDFSPESSYNVVVAAERSSAGENDYKVSKSRMATIVADVFSNTAVAENKVVDIYTDPEGTRKTIDELFSAIPEDGRRKVYADAVAKAEAEEKAAEIAKESAKAAKKISEQQSSASQETEESEEASVETIFDKAKGFGAGISWDKFSSQLSSPKSAKKQSEQQPLASEEEEEATGVSVDTLFKKAKGFGAGISWDKLSSQISTAVQSSENGEVPKVQVATVRGQAKARTLTAVKAVTKKAPMTRKPVLQKKVKEEAEGNVKVEEKKKEVRNILGGLFKQETIYVDE